MMILILAMISYVLIFSVTRRSRSDECDLLTESLIVRTDFTDVTLVSQDTFKRLEY